MNKLTLFSLSLLMITACQAIEEKPCTPENKECISQKKEPNDKITQFILGRLQRSEGKNWCRKFRDGTFICNEYIKEAVVNSNIQSPSEKFNATTVDYDDNTKNSGHSTFRLSIDPLNNIIDLDTTLWIKGISEMTKFENEFDFTLDETVTKKRVTRANDDHTSCREAYEDIDFSDPRIISGIYHCKTKIPYDTFVKRMQNKSKNTPIRFARWWRKL